MITFVTYEEADNILGRESEVCNDCVKEESCPGFDDCFGGIYLDIIPEEEFLKDEQEPTFVTYEEYEEIFGDKVDNPCDSCCLEYGGDDCQVLTCICGLYVMLPAVEVEKEEEDLTKQDHYNWRGGVEAKDFCLKHNVPGPEWNVLKYVYRYPEKDGLKDLKKALVYCGYRAENIDDSVLMNLNDIEDYIIGNGFTYREGRIIQTMLSGLPSFAADNIKKLMKEVYDYEEE